MYLNVINTALKHTEKKKYKLTRTMLWDDIERKLGELKRPKNINWFSIDFTTDPPVYEYGIKINMNIYDWDAGLDIEPWL